MNAETEWTLATLHVHLLALVEEADRRSGQRFESQEKAVNAALIAAKEAVNAALIAAKEAVIKAEGSTEKRFDATNEFRAQLADQASTFMPRAEAEQRIGQMAEKLSDLDRRLTDSLAAVVTQLSAGVGRSSGYATAWSVLLGALVVAVALYNALHK